MSKENGKISAKRYELYALAKDWMDVFMKSEEAKTLGQSEITKKVIEDILEGRVSEEEIIKAKKKMAQKAPENQEKKSANKVQ